MNAPDRIRHDSLRFERMLDAPIEKVWAYLVDPELRSRWFMGGPTDTKVGGSIGMTMNHDQLSDEKVSTPARYVQYLGHSWNERITRIEPPRLLAFTWESGAAGEVTFELADQAGRTRLVLTHTGLRGRDDAINFGGGWYSHLVLLEQRIAGGGVSDFWRLHDEAEARMKQALE